MFQKLFPKLELQLRLSQLHSLAVHRNVVPIRPRYQAIDILPRNLNTLKSRRAA